MFPKPSKKLGLSGSDKATQLKEQAKAEIKQKNSAYLAEHGQKTLDDQTVAGAALSQSHLPGVNRPLPTATKFASATSGVSSSVNAEAALAAVKRQDKSGLVYSCQIGDLPLDTFQLTEFTLDEAMSELFTLSLSAVSARPYIDFDSQLGKASSLTVFRNGIALRTVNGILAGVEQGNTDGVKTWYQMVIRPEMWIMTLNQDSRIFQQQSVPMILNSLLDEAHVKADCKFYQDDLHPERDYITQKRESAFEFWCRLAFEEGINFWFEEKQMFYSDNHLGMTAGIHLNYNPQTDTDHADSTAFNWRYGEYLCVDQTIHKDNNFIRPSYSLDHTAKIENGGQHTVFESYGRFQVDAEGKPLTDIRLQQLRNGSKAGSTKTNCFNLMPGKIFTLSGHPHDPMNTSWQVTRVRHQGSQPLADNSGGQGTTFTNNVDFIPGTLEWRPPYRFKPLADGDEVATVVGPEGEEIYVNEHGAVKVYFHWDRYGEPNHSASCWVRVAMGWNGNGYGFSAVPRIGQEVIVSYLNGDIDRPIITGCTYNGRNRPPSEFPANKTQTAFRTKTHKGEGFNELRFEDEYGKQEVFIHAQKDMNTKVLNDRSTHVLRDHTETIDKNQTIEVKEDRKETIEGNNSEEVGKHKSVKVANSLSVDVGDVIELKCGLSVLRMDSSGHVTINGTEFKFEASGPVQITGNDIDLN